MIRLSSEQTGQHVAWVNELPERREDNSDHVVQEIDQTADVTKIVQQSVCLPDSHLFLWRNCDQIADESPLSFGLLD